MARPGLHLALVFPTPLPIVLRRRWLIPAVYAVALGAYAAAMGAGAVATTTNLEWVGAWPVAQVAVVVPLLSLYLVVFVRSYRRTTDVATRTRIRWAWLGVVASGGIGLLCFMLPELVLQRTLLPASWIGITAMPLPLGIAAGILLGHLFDIDVVVRRTFVYGGLTLGVVATYVAIASGITSFVGGGHGFEVSLVATASPLSSPCRSATGSSEASRACCTASETNRGGRCAASASVSTSRPTRVAPTRSSWTPWRMRCVSHRRARGRR